LVRLEEVMDEEARTGKRVILFWDLHNYSVAARELGARQASFLQESYERMGEIVVSHGGAIVKYVGDAMLCVFPEAAEVQAVASALSMRPAFAALAQEWGLHVDTTLEVGISSGEVTTGVFGHRSLRMRDVVGEMVNVAATIGHHEGIAVTEGVRDVVRGAYKTRRLPDLRVKWQDEALRIWEVLEG
jgi:class 3 adenylate cyclase